MTTSHTDHIAELRAYSTVERAAADWTAELDAANARLASAADILRAIPFIAINGFCPYCHRRTLRNFTDHDDAEPHKSDCLVALATAWLADGGETGS